MTNGTAGNDGRPYTPSDGAIIFTMLYIIGGMVVMGTSLGLLLQSMLEGGSNSQTPHIIARNPLVASAVLCVVMMAIGATFIVVSREEDLLEGSAGHDVVHGLYWAVVTMSTVGYGSGAPKTDGGRFFAGCFMLAGVSCMGNFVGELSARPLRAHRARLEEKVINQVTRGHGAHRKTRGLLLPLRAPPCRHLAATLPPLSRHLRSSSRGVHADRSRCVPVRREP